MPSQGMELTKKGETKREIRKRELTKKGETKRERRKRELT